jgi:hypothetical protein
MGRPQSRPIRSNSSSGKNRISRQRRAFAFAELKARVGVERGQADHRTLADIAKAGIPADLSVEKLLTVAKIAYEEFSGDLRSALSLPVPLAKKALQKSQHRRTGSREDTIVLPDSGS